MAIVVENNNLVFLDQTTQFFLFLLYSVENISASKFYFFFQLQRP